MSSAVHETSAVILWAYAHLLTNSPPGAHPAFAAPSLKEHATWFPRFNRRRATRRPAAGTRSRHGAATATTRARGRPPEA